ncbi:MAG: AAA family ATPase [Proteobacteria bacterium]|nr:AAA family ATPase [Pseudomonadota bacterium]
MNEIRSDMSEQYPWVKFYEAVATKLLEYKSREKRRELAQMMYDIADEVGVDGCKNLFSLRTEYGENKDKTKPHVVSDDVSPYTVFFFMNCNVTKENRIRIITLIGERLGISNEIERPTLFDALPTMQLRNPGNLRWDSGKDWFRSEKDSEQKDKIWEQYELAIQYADGDSSKLSKQKQLFDEVCSYKRVGYGLTKGMFYIRPNSYMTMDDNSRKYISDNMGIEIPKGKLTADKYFNALGEMRNKFSSSDSEVHSFIDVSKVAYNGGDDTDDESGVENVRECLDKGDVTLVMRYAQHLKRCRNLVLTGAPGTGKTYLARQIAEAMNDGLDLSDDAQKKCIGFVQFHPSYDYVDFVEGLRPFKSESGEQVIFERQDGIFKEFCKRAIEKPYILASDEVDNFDDAWKNLKSKAEENDDNVLSIKSLKGKEVNIRPYRYYSDGFAGLVYKNNEWVLRTGMFFNKEQCYNVYRGQKGNKSGTFDNYRKAIVQFMKDECGLKEYQAGTVNARKTINYVFIIDEINRGDLSKIFGELFYALDPGYRGKDKGRVKTQYQKLVDCEDDEFSGDGFYVPENVYIIGTMNDIDRSVESMDFALRRRFAWHKIRPEDTASEMGLSADARERMDAVNRVIRAIPELGEDYQLGGAYFLKMNDDADALSAEELWKYHLESLIDEYLRGLPDACEKKDRIKSAYDLRDDVTDEDMS